MTGGYKGRNRALIREAVRRWGGLELQRSLGGLNRQLSSWAAEKVFYARNHIGTKSKRICVGMALARAAGRRQVAQRMRPQGQQLGDESEKHAWRRWRE